MRTCFSLRPRRPRGRRRDRRKSKERRRNTTRQSGTLSAGRMASVLFCFPGLRGQSTARGQSHERGEISTMERLATDAAVKKWIEMNLPPIAAPFCTEVGLYRRGSAASASGRPIGERGRSLLLSLAEETLTGRIPRILYHRDWLKR